MEQKATVIFDPIDKTLTIKGELLPHQPIVHDKLVELVGGGMNTLEGDGDFKVEKDIVTYSFTFKKRAEELPWRAVIVPDGLPSAADLDIVANEAAKTQDAS